VRRIKLLRFLGRPETPPIGDAADKVGHFLAALTKVAPPAGRGDYAFTGEDGTRRGVVQFIPQSGNAIEIHRLWSLQFGNGAGSYMLRTLCDLADRHGIELRLKPLPFRRKPYPRSKEELIEWYERYGFVGSARGMKRSPQRVNAN